MALIDRYLQAVKFWLPRNQKDDIIVELSEDLHSQIEEKETELGHPLTDAEVEPILKRCGPPMVVAGRFLPQRYLIGPGLFPIYSVVIRALFLYFLLPWLLLWMGVSIFSSDFRADHPGMALFAPLGQWWLACTWSLVINTLIFAVLDRSQSYSQRINDWNPRTLPPERDPNRVSRGSTIFELTIVVATLAVWVQLDAFHRAFHFFGLTVTLSSHWPDFFWGLVALSLAGIVVSGLNLAKARWTLLSATLRLVLDGGSCGLIYWLCRSNLLQSLSGNDIPSTEAATAISFLNHWLARSAVWVLVVGLIVLFFDIRRIVRVARLR